MRLRRFIRETRVGDLECPSAARRLDARYLPLSISGSPGAAPSTGWARPGGGTEAFLDRSAGRAKWSTYGRIRIPCMAPE